MKPSPDFWMRVGRGAALNEIDPMAAPTIGRQDEVRDKGSVSLMVEVFGLMPVSELSTL